MASGDTPKTIILKGDPLAGEAAAATANIKPGMLIELTSAGKVQPHSTAGSVGVGQGVASKTFAKEADYVGDGIDDTYEADERVPYYTARPGDEIYAFLSYGENVAIGDYLESDGAGALEALESDSWPVAQAIEAVDNTLGGAAARIKVRIV